jgi:glycogen debranching enzyme
MRSIGHDEDAVRVFAAHVDIACAASDSRLHELYCGTARTAESKQPKHYKVACVPQAWAAGSILHMLRACVNPQPSKGKLRIVQSLLPDWLPWVTLTGVKVGAAKVDLKFTRTDTGETTCTVLRKEKGVRVVIKAATRP